MDLERPWPEYTYVAFDTETSGGFPLNSEICEIAAVKWRGGQVIDTFQTLVKITKKIPDEIIAIHGITNEMLVGAPDIKEVAHTFVKFCGDAILIAHHAPFDLGFLAIEFEKFQIPLPLSPALCTSLLAIKLFPESSNHKLQTLIKFFNLQQGKAHRAMDDAMACLEVCLRCLRKLGEHATLQYAFTQQGVTLRWDRFSIKTLRAIPKFEALFEALAKGEAVDITYSSGSTPGLPRPIFPKGFVRSIDGDYLIATCLKENTQKRFYADRIQSVRLGTAQPIPASTTNK